MLAVAERPRGALRVDWFRVLADLQYAGLPNLQVAKLLDVPQPTVRSWKGGCQPRFDDGDRLVQLWMDKTGHERSDVPRISAYDWRA